MRPRTLTDVARAVRGRLIPDQARDRMVTGVTVDSRTAVDGDLFVALVGERSDGHAFVDAAFRTGAVAALVAAGRSRAPGSGPVVEVEVTDRALQDLARDEREGSTATVIAVTGSTGKTCTKDLTAAVLGRQLRTVASVASFNNEVGLPLTVLSAGEDTQAVVCEMGSRGPGHIRFLCDIARPDVGIVTNVGVAHMELFGSARALHDAKAELPESLSPDGVAVLNADDEVVRGYALRTPARVVLYGSSPGADVRAENVEMSRGSGRASFDLVLRDGSARVTLPVAGEHMVPNALAAAAAGWALDVPLGEIVSGLEAARLTGGRMEVSVTPDGIRIVDDAYNANPTSMAAALKAARWMAGDGRCIAVLGEMAELGPIAAGEHERIGELAARLRVDVLVVVGLGARLIAEAGEREGVEPDHVFRVDDADEAIRVVRDVARTGDLVLVKASRVARLERVAEVLRRGEGSPPDGSDRSAGPTPAVLGGTNG